MMREIASVLQSKVWQAPLLKKMTYEKWREHVLAHHVPYNKECGICQEACAKEPYHRRSKLPPRAGVLSIDVSGPFHEAPDLFRGTKAKYLLVVAFTWPTQKSEEQKKKEKEELWEIMADLEEAPEIEDGEDFANDEKSEEVVEEEKTKKKKRSERTSGQMGGHMRSFPQRIEKKWRLPSEKPFGMDLIRFVTPMSSRNQREVLKAISKFYLQLKAEGYEVS